MENIKSAFPHFSLTLHQYFQTIFMDFFKFLVSKTFLKNLVAAIILLVLIIFGLKIYLDSYTHHNDYHLVPDLTNKSYEQAKKILEDRKMQIVVIDTVDYNPKFNKYAIVEQNPIRNDKVKVGRKIYVKINNNAYAKISFPEVVGKSRRQALSLIKASGLRVGKITTQPYFAEIVLKAIHQKDTLKTGFKIPKNSVINLIIGDGKRAVDEDKQPHEPESTDTQKPNADIQKTLDDVLGN